jgi:hypothetical protein
LSLRPMSWSSAFTAFLQRDVPPRDESHKSTLALVSIDRRNESSRMFVAYIDFKQYCEKITRLLLQIADPMPIAHAL